MSNVQCPQCKGTGVVTATRSRWIGGTRNGYESRQTSEVRCDACHGTGETRRIVTFPSDRLGFVTVPDAAPKGAA